MRSVMITLLGMRRGEIRWVGSRQPEAATGLRIDAEQQVQILRGIKSKFVSLLLFLCGGQMSIAVRVVAQNCVEPLLMKPVT